MEREIISIAYNLIEFDGKKSDYEFAVHWDDGSCVIGENFGDVWSEVTQEEREQISEFLARKPNKQHRNLCGRQLRVGW